MNIMAGFFFWMAVIFWGLVIIGVLAWAIDRIPRRGKGRDIF